MKFVIGLGNPGEKYAHTRHNIGFLFCDYFHDHFKFPAFHYEKKFYSHITARNFSDTHNNVLHITLIKPSTFMNNSGLSVRTVLDFYKKTPADIIIVHDDIDINIGSYKIAKDSRSAGNNGVQSIIDHLGTQKFIRIRIGIRPLEHVQISTKNYVLQEIAQSESETILNLFPKIGEDIFKLI